MSTEKPTSLEIKEPKVWASNEEVNQKESSSELSKKLTQINNVLQVLDFSNNKEQSYRKILEQQKPKVLKDLAQKSKTEIILFLISVKKEWLKTEKEKTVKIDNAELEKQTLENPKNSQKNPKNKINIPTLNFK